MLLTDKVKELAASRAKIAELEKSIATDLSQELSSLPGKYGFDSVAAFIKAVKAASTGQPSARRGNGSAKLGRKRTRAKITDETRKSVKELVAQGKTGAEIAKTLGISLPSVQNIKKALGLVRKAKS